MSRRVLTDHAHAFRELVDCLEHLLSKLVEQLVQVAEQRAECLPVVVLVVGVEHERVRRLLTKRLHDRAVRRVLARYVAREFVSLTKFRGSCHVRPPVEAGFSWPEPCRRQSRLQTVTRCKA